MAFGGNDLKCHDHHHSSHGYELSKSNRLSYHANIAFHIFLFSSIIRNKKADNWIIQIKSGGLPSFASTETDADWIKIQLQNS